MLNGVMVGGGGATIIKVVLKQYIKDFAMLRWCRCSTPLKGIL